MNYRDGYIYGQHDVLNWLTRGDDGDQPLAPIDEFVQQRAWAWCLAHNLAIGAGLRWSYWVGYDAEGMAPTHWLPGCGKAVP